MGVDIALLMQFSRQIYPIRIWGIKKKRAGDGIRTHEYHLGKVVPYRLATPAQY